MFRDLLKLSDCHSKNNMISIPITEVGDKKYQKLYEKSHVPYEISPTGFIFHESRVGSTLVANMLSSDPYSMVFSESAPPASVLLHCKKCSKDDQLKLFKTVVSLMCRSTYHKYCFFKFQSITTTMMNLALKAFPQVPWIFLYRQPIETMMSHVGNGKGNNAPCLRSKRKPPREVP